LHVNIAVSEVPEGERVEEAGEDMEGEFALTTVRAYPNK
jgi:hypothetical protein